jgi:hypothetical protein
MERGMTYKGHVENGVIVLDDETTLPEGTTVHVEPLASEGEFDKLRQDLLSLAGIAKGMPNDMARNHDHYLHGTRRK